MALMRMKGADRSDNHRQTSAPRSLARFHSAPARKTTTTGEAMGARISWAYLKMFSQRITIGASKAPTSSAMAPDQRPTLTRRASDQLRPPDCCTRSSVTMVDVEFTRPETVDMIPLMIAATTGPRQPCGTTLATTAGGHVGV